MNRPVDPHVAPPFFPKEIKSEDIPRGAMLAIFACDACRAGASSIVAVESEYGGSYTLPVGWKRVAEIILCYACRCKSSLDTDASSIPCNQAMGRDVRK